MAHLAAHRPTGTADRVWLDGHATTPWSRAAWAMAIADLRGGVAAWRLWSLMARNDIRHRYRRSVLGPFWLTLSVTILIGALSILYGALLGIPLQSYLPFLTLGFLTWSFLSALVSDGCLSLIEGDSYLKQARLPKSMFVYRIVWRNVLVFAHNLIVFVVVAIWFEIPVTWWSLAGVAAFVVLCVNGVWIGLLLGMVSARFRDLPQIVAAGMQVLFFVTPILFKPELLGRRAFLLEYNPLLHFVAIVRQPLLGEVPRLDNWLVVLAVTVAGATATFLMFVRFRARITYWL